jgi:hypothetical protein
MITMIRVVMSCDVDSIRIYYVNDSGIDILMGRNQVVEGLMEGLMESVKNISLNVNDDRTERNGASRQFEEVREAYPSCDDSDGHLSSWRTTTRKKTILRQSRASRADQCWMQSQVIVDR